MDTELPETHQRRGHMHSSDSSTGMGDGYQRRDSTRYSNTTLNIKVESIYK